MPFKLWLILFVFFLIAQGVARAGEVINTVFNVYESKRTDKILVLSASDGRIYKSKKNDANLKQLKSLQGQVVKITFSNVGKEALISKIEIPKASEVDTSTMDLNHFRYNQLRQFAPTDLQTEEKVNTVFTTMLNDGDKGRSQCFKRAHMWAYDMWTGMQINSQKIFIFYTKRYALLEEFEWWFHVAPMVVANGVEYVMDGTFMTKPVRLEDWKNHFMKSEKITCPVVENYNDYDKNQWNRLCYLMKVPMYYLSPLDVENRDTKGIEKNHWVLGELQDARRAFKKYEETYEGLDSGKDTTTY